MTGLKLLPLNVPGGSLLPLLLLLVLHRSAVCESENFSEEFVDHTPTPEDGDYNTTFEIIFFSNTSAEELDNFRKQYINPEDEEEEGDEDEEEEGGEEKSEEGGKQQEKMPVPVGAASLPVSLELRLLVWSLAVLVVVNSLRL